jgi:hypothetical protein
LGDSYEGQLKNNYLYQGAFSELDEDIGWTDFALRNYDAQIGRWVQQVHPLLVCHNKTI